MVDIQKELSKIESESNIDDEVAQMDTKIEELLADPKKEDKDNDILIEITKPVSNDDKITSMDDQDKIDTNGLDTNGESQDSFFFKDEPTTVSDDSSKNPFDFLNTNKESEEEKKNDDQGTEENENPFKGFF